MGVARYLEGFDPRPIAEATVRRMHQTFLFGRSVIAPMNAPDDRPQVELWCVRRDVFDHALASAAAQHGSDVLEGIHVDGIEARGAEIVVTGRSQGNGVAWRASADHVIAADGATGVVARLMNLQPHRLQAIAMEAEVPHRWGTGHFSLEPDTIHLEFGVVPNGYAWIFPNRERLNIGAGLFRGSGVAGNTVRKLLMGAMQDYARHLGIEVRWGEVTIHAHPLPLWSGRSRLHGAGGRVLLAGDAAALVNPLFGDGIHNAVRSGRIAVECILSGRPEEYSARIHTSLGVDLRAASRLASFFYRFPKECYSLAIMRPGAARIAARLLNGDMSYRELVPRAMRRIVRALATS